MSNTNNQVQSQTLSPAEMQAELEKLRAENAKLKNKAQGGFKVTEKGGVSMYGLGRFPVTLYAQQWEKLIARIPELQAFIEANKAKLTFKTGEKTEQVEAQVDVA